MLLSVVLLPQKRIKNVGFRFYPPIAVFLRRGLIARLLGSARLYSPERKSASHFQARRLSPVPDPARVMLPPLRLALLLLAAALAEQSLPAGWTAHVHGGRTYVRARC